MIPSAKLALRENELFPQFDDAKAQRRKRSPGQLMQSTISSANHQAKPLTATHHPRVSSVRGTFFSSGSQEAAATLLVGMPSDNSRNFTENIIKQSLSNRLHMAATAGVKPFNLAFTLAGGLPASTKPEEGGGVF